VGEEAGGELVMLIGREDGVDSAILGSLGSEGLPASPATMLKSTIARPSQNIALPRKLPKRQLRPEVASPATTG
jgi:hypothetical protein